MSRLREFVFSSNHIEMKIEKSKSERIWEVINGLRGSKKFRTFNLGIELASITCIGFYVCSSRRKIRSYQHLQSQ